MTSKLNLIIKSVINSDLALPPPDEYGHSVGGGRGGEGGRAQVEGHQRVARHVHGEAGQRGREQTGQALGRREDAWGSLNMASCLTFSM